jgi:hypothetical protein
VFSSPEINLQISDRRVLGGAKKVNDPIFVSDTVRASFQCEKTFEPLPEGWFAYIGREKCSGTTRLKGRVTHYMMPGRSLSNEWLACLTSLHLRLQLNV